MGGSSHFFRVMSFNVLLDWRREGPYVWSNRKDLAASMIRFHHSDVVGLQEPLRNQIDDLCDLLPEYAWLGVGRDDGKNKGEFAAIFYRKDRMEPTAEGTFWLSETPDSPGSLGWDAVCVRTVTWARFVDKQKGNIFYHFNTHFDHVGQDAQRESAILMLSRIDSIAGKAPVIVTGDFNCTEESEAYKVLTGKSAVKHSGDALMDGLYKSINKHHGPVETFHGLEDEELKQKIDYIFVKNGVKVLQHGVLADKWDKGYPSDHSPVIADVIIG